MYLLQASHKTQVMPHFYLSWQPAAYLHQNRATQTLGRRIQHGIIFITSHSRKQATVSPSGNYTILIHRNSVSKIDL